MSADPLAASLEQISRQIERGELAEAEAGCHRLLAQQADLGPAFFLLGRVLRASGRSGAARLCLERAIRALPAHAEYRLQLCELLQQQGDRAALLQQLDWCAALLPQRPDLLLQAGQIHYSEGRYEPALERYSRAHALGLRGPQIELCLATALHSLRRVEQAEPWFQSVRQQLPDSPAVRWEYSMQQLLCGRWGEGWDGYEARLELYGHRRLNAYAFPWPAWNGEPLQGKTLLIHGEQGLGDEIMFCSMAPELAAQARRCIVACSPVLQPLFAHSFAQAEVHAFHRGNPAQWDEQPPALLREAGAVDYQIAMGSLPRLLRRSAPSFSAAAKPYLRAERSRVQAMQQRLQGLLGNGPRPLLVGLAWSGNLQNGLIGSRKSIPVELLRPLAALRGVRWVSLHQADYGHQAERVPELGILDFSQHLGDAADTAALIECLDLVVSVDTMIAHLAGALGKTAWLPLWQAADWRWELAAPTSLWYHDVRLFRQETAGEWEPVLARIAAELNMVLQQRAAAPLRQGGVR